jgi:drug/metabolite transporter (DMT)-like permease
LSSTLLAELAALSCAVLWAINALLMRTQADRIPPATMNATRCAVAGVLFLLLLPFDPDLAGLGRVPTHELALLAASVVLGIGVGDTLYLIALREIGVARAMALSGVYPLTTLAWEAAVLRRAPDTSLVLGAALVAAGVVLLSRGSGPPGPERLGRASPARWNEPSGQGRPADAAATRLQTRIRQPRPLHPGVCLALLSAALWGLSSVLLKPAIAHLTLIQANALRMPMVAVLLFAFRVLPSRTEGLRAFDRRSFLVVAATGLLGMGLSAYLFLYAIGNTAVTKAVTLTSTAPLFGLLFGALFMRERLTARLGFGMACCMGGVWAAL